MEPLPATIYFVRYLHNLGNNALDSEKKTVFIQDLTVFMVYYKSANILLGCVLLGLYFIN